MSCKTQKLFPLTISSYPHAIKISAHDTHCPGKRRIKCLALVTSSLLLSQTMVWCPPFSQSAMAEPPPSADVIEPMQPIIVSGSGDVLADPFNAGSAQNDIGADDSSLADELAQIEPAIGPAAGLLGGNALLAAAVMMGHPAPQALAMTARPILPLLILRRPLLRLHL